MFPSKNLGNSYRLTMLQVAAGDLVFLDESVSNRVANNQLSEARIGLIDYL